jgi:predicted Zn-dependent peptidase
MTARLATLDNGLRIVTEAMPNLESATIGIWVDVGARHEPIGVHGVSHLLEHMAFKGTERRSAQAIAEEIEAVGGHLNAYTGREHTAYYARVLKQDVPLALDILADILGHSVFATDELERERQVVIQEIGQAEDTPDDIVFDFLQEAAYADQALGRTILGTAESVGGMRREALAGYMAGHYGAGAMVLAASGAVDHDAVVALARDLFGAFPRGAGNPFERAAYRGGERREARDLEQAHVTLGFEGVTYDDADFYPSQVYSTVLGGGMSSRLFQEVREKRGLCYSVFSFGSSYVDTGLIGVYAGTGEAEVARLLPVILGEMEGLAGDAGEDETARARAQIKAGLLMGLESSSNRAEQLARQLLIFGRVLPVEEIVERIDAVDAAAVRRFADRVLRRAGPSLAALGPIETLDDVTKIAARLG